ncbi:Phosphoribosylglycinamide formyltransferase [Wallemia ichthyophaga EXF-994]|uniref:phosphoribosylglycinamide formyltransferase 1 n=1 Tax=Wallemia ichthyophaga (strain EXF-994 / CBS 113033) TaxID=1299270 RepID=R9AN39_WALI9|nr:Phosphoribosylglycinamide formyltransferase [Wallemia ichthyophaga EXF-994]EOR03634.1 Phosphoribosylglycinamide formyltransferase [Wallemia ichthyophaga EXF-994]
MNIVVLISGSGSNLQAILDSLPHQHSSTPLGTPAHLHLPPSVNVKAVISNKSNVFGLERAKRCDPPIPTQVLALKTFLNRNPGSSRQDWEIELSNMVNSHKPDLIVLAGFMMILSPAFLNNIHQKPIINLHPALPGAFDGAHAIERAYDAFKQGHISKTGCMVHYVIPQVDRGEPIVVADVDIHKQDTLESMENRIHETEWRIIIQAVKKVLNV